MQQAVQGDGILAINAEPEPRPAALKLETTDACSHPCYPNSNKVPNRELIQYASDTDRRLKLKGDGEYIWMTWEWDQDADEYHSLL
jgi:hypothetical protein